MNSIPTSGPAGKLQSMICFNFYLGWRLIQTYYRSHFPEEMNPQRTYTLYVLHTLGPLGLNELSRHLQLQKSAASQLVGRMTSQGLVYRRPAPDSKREVEIGISPLGEERLAEAADRLAEADEELFSVVDPELVSTLRTVVAQVGEALDRANGRSTSTS